MRIACIDVPALPLQILRRDRPEWAGLPLAVVADDRPQAPVLWASRSAQQLGVRAGMRYAAALGISRELRASTVSAARIAEVRAELVGALHRHSPRVEPDAERPGVVWIDPEGMISLFGSLERWAQSVWATLGAHDLFGAAVVGFERMRCWAVARTRRDAKVIASAEEERRLAGRVPIARLDVPPELESALHVLGVRTLDDFLALPPGELSVRFGPAAARLHALFAGALREPMSPQHEIPRITICAELDPPDDDLARLLFCVKGALHALHAALAQRSLALAALTLTLRLERGRTHVETLRPARASRDVSSMLELVRLRLLSLELSAAGGLAPEGRSARTGRSGASTPHETRALVSEGSGRSAGDRARAPARRGHERADARAWNERAEDRQGARTEGAPIGRVERIELEAEPAPLEGTQLSLIAGARRRDPDAAARGLARLRAAFGDDAVTCARLEDAWLPENRFRWEPVRTIAAPRVMRDPGAQPATLVRRMTSTPHPITSDPRGGPRLAAPITSIAGPYRLQSGWWAHGVVRDYYYAEQADGALLWLYRDAASARWFVQGLID